MIQKIVSIKNESTEDASFKYILSGNEKASTLAVMVSGMLYDANKPPASSIFLKLKQRIAIKALSLEVEQMDNRFETVFAKKEIPLHGQSDRIEKSVSDVLEKYPKIKNITYIAHSMGSVVLYNLLKNQSTSNRKLNSCCFLLAPVPFGVKVDELAKHTTESLLTKDTNSSTPSSNIYIERDQSKVEINDEIWQCLDNIADDYSNNLSQFSQFEKKNALSFFIAKDDSVFTNNVDSIKNRYPYSKVQILDATHSFRDPVISDIVIDEIYSRIINQK
jgi:hypothetical protein